ncbi:MAG: hypothetical protein AAGG44_12145 [Planctomycetota bacterium]
MTYIGPIDIDALVDLDSLIDHGVCHWTFLAFPRSSVTEDGLPSDSEAQRYIGAVQSAGVPVGIWLNAPTDDTAYAAVTRDHITQLHEAIAGLPQFSDSYAAELSERLFRDFDSGGS